MKLNETQVIAMVGTLSAGELHLWVRRGWVLPTESSTGVVYDETDVARIRLICQLRDDLGLDEEAVPLVLSLMDQVYGLRRELRALTRALEREPGDVRERVCTAWRTRIRRRGP